MMAKVCCGFLLVLTVVVVGCGESDPLGRRPVSGEVTLEGQPLAQGTISFEPSEKGTSAGATIADGRYSISTEVGLPPGKYVVRISSPTGGVATPEAPGESDQLATEQIPEDFNAKSIVKVDVLKEGQNTFNFFIPNKAK